MIVPVPRGTEPPHTCRVCERGCGCPLTGPGCEHYGCWGRWPTRSCPGVRAEEDRYAAAIAERRAREARTLAARQAHASLLRAVAGLSGTVPL